jgi:hypothetical protein
VVPAFEMFRDGPSDTKPKLDKVLARTRSCFVSSTTCIGKVEKLRRIHDHDVVRSPGPECHQPNARIYCPTLRPPPNTMSDAHLAPRPLPLNRPRASASTAASSGYASFLAGALAGASEGLITYPTDLCKTKMQLGSAAASSSGSKVSCHRSPV